MSHAFIYNIIKRGEFMLGLKKNSPYRKALIELIGSINFEIGLSKENQVLIVLKLDTEEKIIMFNYWIKLKIQNQKFLYFFIRCIIPALVVGVINFDIKTFGDVGEKSCVQFGQSILLLLTISIINTKSESNIIVDILFKIL